MKKRSIGLMVLWTILTGGIYFLYWFIAFQMELKRETGQGFGGFGHFLMSIFTFGIYTIYWNYAAGKRLHQLGLEDNSTLYLILTIVGFGLIGNLLMQSKANEIAVR